MQIKTFTGSFPASLDRKVNEFLARPDIEVLRIHAASSFGTHLIVVEYNPR